MLLGKLVGRAAQPTGREVSIYNADPVGRKGTEEAAAQPPGCRGQNASLSLLGCRGQQGGGRGDKPNSRQSDGALEGSRGGPGSGG